MSSRTASLAKKKLKSAFVCEADNCRFACNSGELLRGHSELQHPELRTLCKCGTAFADEMELGEHKRRCPLQYGKSHNKIKKAIIENSSREKSIDESLLLAED